MQTLGGRPFQLPPLCSTCDGHSLHAGVVIGAKDREGLRRLSGTIAPPPLAKEWLDVLPGDRVRIGLKRGWSDGTTVCEHKSSGCVLFFSHDLDFFSRSSMPVVGNEDLARLLGDPAHERSYYGHLNDIMEQAYSSAYLGPWCDQLDALLPAQDFDAHCRFVDDRADWVRDASPVSVLARYPSIDFRITTNGGDDFTVASAEVSLQGEG